MYFSGGSSSGKRVDLGGKSSKQRDSRKLIEEARVERKRRQDSKQRAAAALQIQKCFRGRKAIAEAHAEVRAKFLREFGDSCQKVDRHCFSPRSDFLPRLLFFFNPNSVGDVNILVKTCQMLHRFAAPNGDFVSVFSGKDLAAELSIVSLRVKRLAFACILAIHHNREKFQDQLLLSCDSAETPSFVLLETAGGLIEPKAPWSCKVVGFLSQRNVFGLLRDIIILLILKTEVPRYSKLQASSLERFLIKVTSLASLPSCDCATLDPRRSFPLQILSLPMVWQVLPEFKKVFATQGLFGHYVQQMSMFLPLPMSSLPTDTTKEYPSYACILGNLLEVAEMAISQPNFTVEVVLDFATVVTFWLEALPPFLAPSSREADDDGDLDMEERTKEISLGEDLKDQISNSMLSGLLKQLVNILLKEIRNLYELHSVRNSSFEAAATGAICGLLHVIFSTFQLERIVTVLAYNTELVPVLWSFMKRCHDSQNWPTFPGFKSTISDAPGWLLPLSVFCPVYRHMLMIIDNEEFYEKQKPLSLADVRSLVIILKEALWHLLWIMPSKSSVKTLTSQKSLENLSSHGCLSVDFICHRASLGAAELLTQLEDWNNRRQFASADEFNSSEAVSEVFLSQAITENTRANAILRQAPFLVPFTCRVRIYMSQLGEIRNSDRLHAVTSPHRFRIRRDRIVEDAFGLISQLTEQDLKGMMRIAFVNELGVEEAGIDGGGIFKDFMESITKTAFDVQYGLFKETSDHMLYPNPASGMIHEQHLQYFRFLGIILGKAMFEGILVDIPFATFFLSKLKQKHNYLNDLPSLDPELYRHLLFLKRYEGDISELSLNFVIVNNEYGEQTEEELLPGGKDIQVTNDNVIMFIHLIANHRLNTQIRKQSKNFLQGVQQLIQPKWMAMFNEHELQLLISGSLDGMDVNDLCSNANYSGGYHEKHPVIEMFWETVRNFSAQQQKKFLKFVTGCSRGPLLGFKYLEPPFCIQRVVPDDALDRLPTSATCMNLLKLPPYTTKEKMEMKLVYAIYAEAGFDLS